MRESFCTAAGSGSNDLSQSFCPLNVRCYKLSGEAADKLFTLPLAVIRSIHCIRIICLLAKLSCYQ